MPRELRSSCCSDSAQPWARMRASSSFMRSLLAMVCEVKTVSSCVASQRLHSSSLRIASISMPEAVTCAGTRAPSTYPVLMLRLGPLRAM